MIKYKLIDKTGKTIDNNIYYAHCDNNIESDGQPLQINENYSITIDDMRKNITITDMCCIDPNVDEYQIDENIIINAPIIIKYEKMDIIPSNNILSHGEQVKLLDEMSVFQPELKDKKIYKLYFKEESERNISEKDFSDKNYNQMTDKEINNDIMVLFDLESNRYDISKESTSPNFDDNRKAPGDTGCAKEDYL